jgi:hypothetical protein
VQAGHRVALPAGDDARQVGAEGPDIPQPAGARLGQALVRQVLAGVLGPGAMLAVGARLAWQLGRAQGAEQQARQAEAEARAQAAQAAQAGQAEQAALRQLDAARKAAAPAADRRQVRARRALR